MMLCNITGNLSAGRFLVVLTVLSVSMAAAVTASAQAQSSNAARVKFSAAAEMQNEGLFELASGEYRDFLKEFPDDPLAAKARHYLGICLIQEKKFGEAAQELSQVVTAHPKFESLDETLMNLGSAQYNVANAAKKPKEFAKPAATYEQLITQFPKSKLLAGALYNQGECYYALGDRKKATASYAKLLEQFPDDKLAPDTQYALGVSQLELNQPDKALASFDAFLKGYPDHELTTRVTMHKADALFDKEKYDEAEKLYAAIADTKGFDLADRCTMRQADCLTNRKRYGDAAAIYASIPEKFPKSSHIPAATLAAGSRYHLEGNHEKAIEWLGKVTGGDAAEAAHWLARSYLATKKPAEALAAVEKVLPKAKKSEYLVDLLLDQADAAYELPDRRKDSVTFYAEIADKHAKHKKAPTALYYAAWAAFNLNQYDAALQYTDRFLKDYPDHDLLGSVRSVAADSYLNTGKFAAAEELYRTLIQEDPKHADASRWQLLLGWSLYRQKKYQDTITQLEPLIPSLKDADRLGEAQFLLGSSHFALKQYDKARDRLQQCLEAAPQGGQVAEAMLLLSRSQRQLKDTKAAQATVRRLITEHPESELLDRAKYHLAEYLYSSGDFKGAAATYEEILKDHADSTIAPSSMYWLGWSRLSLQDYAAADKAFSQLLEQHADHEQAASALYARAQARRLSGNAAGTIEDINAFLATEPSQKERLNALFERGLAEMDTKKFPAAVESFNTILKDDPKYGAADKVKYQLAWSLKDSNQQDKAAETFDQLAKDHPKSPFAAEAMYHVAEQQYANQQYSEAAANYAAAVEKAAKAKQIDLAEMAIHKLGWSHYHQDEFAEAHDAFTRQLSTYGKGKLATDARFMAAECLFKQSQHAEALEAYAALRENPPASKDFQLLALLHAGQAAAQLKQWDDSIAYLEECREKFPDSPYNPDALYEIAWSKQNKGQLDDALALYKEVADTTQREVGARARLMMGEVKFEKGEHKQAIVDFFKVFKGYQGAPASYNRWKAQALYETGRCFEVLKKTDYAKKYYQQLVDEYPDNQLVTLAKERLEALK